MRWRGGRESDNVEDRRGMPGGPVVVTGGIGTLLIVLLALFLGVDPRPLLLQQQPGPAPGPQAPAPVGEGGRWCPPERWPGHLGVLA